jgi:hypothetical protein
MASHGNGSHYCLDKCNGDIDFYADKLMHANFVYEQIFPTASPISLGVRFGCRSLLT